MRRFFCFPLGQGAVERIWCITQRAFAVTTQVVVCWLGILYGAPRRGNLRIAQSAASLCPGHCRPSSPFALQGQKRKNQRLLFVHTLHLLYMLLPLQGESTVVYSSPRAPLRSALGYAQVAPAGRTDGIIPPMITTQQGADGIIPPMITTQQGADGIIPRILAPSQTGFLGKKRPE